MQTSLTEELELSIKKEIEAYLASSSNMQLYFTSMKKISDWLQKKGN